jgi:plastocyanin
MNRLRNLLFGMGCACLSLVFMGCPYDGPQYPVTYGNPTATPTSASITILGSAYNPASVTITHGGSVVWHNSDPYNHTVDPSGGSPCAADNPVTAGSSVTLTFPNPTTIYYHCSIHASSCNGVCSVTCTGPMTGTILVQ